MIPWVVWNHKLHYITGSIAMAVHASPKEIKGWATDLRRLANEMDRVAEELNQEGPSCAASRCSSI